MNIYKKKDTIDKDAIKRMFSTVATRYDFLNHLLSCGIDRYWRWYTTRMVKVVPRSLILDVAAGTCDLSIDICRRYDKKIKIMATDLSKKMLSIGGNKVHKAGCADQISCQMVDAENLPFKENSFHCVTIAFGIRNVIDREKALKEFLRVTKPGGCLICLEFSHLPCVFLDTLYSHYLAFILPKIASFFQGDYASYKYLSRSIKEFPDQRQFSSLISCCGWDMVKYTNLTGGIVAIHYAVKPTVTG
ncbi:MAG: bifunctional demethylmenaquinone methyltransferase/2-methoxy-6-polyprenyl-1,4-benzoquinol methylase UbiE [bacterium]